jgi:RNA polymerase sigma factor (sigma-70 family)
MPQMDGLANSPDRTSALLSRKIEALVVQWAEVIRKAGYRYGLSSADLDEVTQDFRVRLWKLLERGEAEVTAINATYAWRAASSAAIDLVRRNRTSRSASMVNLDLAPPQHAPDNTDLLDRLDEALAQLQRGRRVAVRLHLDGNSLDEIASTLGWTPAQARNQVYRGLADLKGILTLDVGPRL